MTFLEKGQDKAAQQIRHVPVAKEKNSAYWLVKGMSRTKIRVNRERNPERRWPPFFAGEKSAFQNQGFCKERRIE